MGCLLIFVISTIMIVQFNVKITASQETEPMGTGERLVG